VTAWIGILLAGLAVVAAPDERQAGPERWRPIELPVNGEVLGLGEAPFPDGQRTVWIGTEHGSVRHMAGQWERWPLIDGQNPAVRELMVAPDERGLTHWWLATTDGLYRTRDGQSWLRIDGTASSLVDREVLSLHLDQDAEGQPEIWMGTDSGLIIWRLGRWEAVPARPDGFQGGRITIIRSLNENGARQVWAGGPDGLSRFQEGRWQRWARECLRGLQLAALETLDSGREMLLLAGTHQGLLQLSMTDPEHCRRIEPPIRTSNTVQGMIRDQHERLLVFGPGQIERFSPPRLRGENWQWTFFDHRDGLDYPLSWTGHQRLDGSGRIWAGSDKGVWLLDTAALTGRSERRPELRLKLDSHSVPERSNEPLRFLESEPVLSLSGVTSGRPHAVRYRARLSSAREFSPWQFDSTLSPGPLSFGKHQLIIEMADEFGRIHGPYRYSIQRRLPMTLVLASIAATLLAVVFVLTVVRRQHR
jgi:ligand-binding sensor domain-containing protein